MKRLVINSLLRPHITDDPDGKCWCSPVVHEVEDTDDGQVICHRFLEALPDTQPRMSCYSEQRPL